MAARSLAESQKIVHAAVNACSALPVEPDTLAAPESLVGKSFDDLGFDSLAYMEFCIALQAETGIEVSVATITEMGSPDAVAKHLSATA